MALFTLPIFLPFTIVLTCFAIQSKSIPSSWEGEKQSLFPNPTLLQTSGASIEERKEDEEGKDSRDRVLTEEELSRNGTIRNRLFGLNFNLDIGGRQSYSSSYSSTSMSSYHQAIIAAYCRNLMTAISNARLPPTPPVVVIDPVVTIPPTTNRPRDDPTGSKGSSNVPPATEAEENLQIQSRTLHCLRTSSLFRSTDPYSMVLNMCTSIVTTGRWNYK